MCVNIETYVSYIETYVSYIAWLPCSAHEWYRTLYLCDSCAFEYQGRRHHVAGISDTVLSIVPRLLVSAASKGASHQFVILRIWSLELCFFLLTSTLLMSWSSPRPLNSSIVSQVRNVNPTERSFFEPKLLQLALYFNLKITYPLLFLYNEQDYKVTFLTV